MQRQLIAPVPGGQSKLEALLGHEIRCFATGDLGALAWREPPPLGRVQRKVLTAGLPAVLADLNDAGAHR